MANTTIFGGIGVLLLMLAATMLSVAFATRGAMAANRPIVEVLHFIGATDGFIASQFQRHFLVLGLEGGLIGGGAAIVVFMLAGLAGKWGIGLAGGEQLAMLFGTFVLGIEGYRRDRRSGPPDRGGDGVHLAAHRQPDAADHRVAWRDASGRFRGKIRRGFGSMRPQTSSSPAVSPRC